MQLGLFLNPLPHTTDSFCAKISCFSSSALVSDYLCLLKMYCIGTLGLQVLLKNPFWVAMNLNMKLGESTAFNNVFPFRYMVYVSIQLGLIFFRIQRSFSSCKFCIFLMRFTFCSSWVLLLRMGHLFQVYLRTCYCSRQEIRGGSPQNPTLCIKNCIYSYI